MWRHLGIPQDKEMKKDWEEVQRKRDYILRAFKLWSGRRELLSHFALVDKITGEIHDINA